MVSGSPPSWMLFNFSLLPFKYATQKGTKNLRDRIWPIGINWTLSYWFTHTYINKLSSAPETCYLVISHWDYSKYKKIIFIFFLSSYLTFYLLNCILIITDLSWIPVLHALLCFLSYLWSKYLFQFSSCENWRSEIPNATELEVAEPELKLSSF